VRTMDNFGPCRTKGPMLGGRSIRRYSLAGNCLL
jgi:hypothetical protein